MAKYKKLREGVVEDFTRLVFGTIGKGLRPFFLKSLMSQDPKLAKLIKKGEQSKKDLDDYLKVRTRDVKLTKKQRQAMRQGKIWY